MTWGTASPVWRGRIAQSLSTPTAPGQDPLYEDPRFERGSGTTSKPAWAK